MTYDRHSRTVLVGTHERTTDPFLGERALPGVVVRSGERLRDAALRALAKLAITAAPDGLGHLRTFDEPTRDPRGPSLSIALWAAFSRPPGTADGPALWEPIERPPATVFDHGHILDTARPLLAEKLWRDLDFTRALTGPEFTATDAVAITRQLTGAPVHRANLNRDLARIDSLAEAGFAPTAGGRPPRLWRWV
ncbi:MAG: NUDIX hydrolase [Gordonia sp. (in: high G+C Gram-positive bacteria)]